MVTLTAALRGLLEAGKRFDWVNGIRVPLGVLTFVAPLAVSMATPHLAALCAALAVLRVLALAAHWAACARLMPALAGPGMPRKQAAAEMLGDGAWLTVSNVVGPLMVYVDRFVIGAMLSVAFVAYYTAPQEAITRLWTIPAALTGALFPAMASAGAVAARELYRKGVLGDSPVQCRPRSRPGCSRRNGCGCGWARSLRCRVPARRAGWRSGWR